ncbi:Ubiquinone/menaquinone biosynthesis C-methylase UbiE [bacterium A37T11]|nr:Ubiquinone/menaquinone biosynthesis C-methylase UbiE [bacterium A37T11]
MKKDVFGEALMDHFLQKPPEKLVLHTSYDEDEEMPITEFFRSSDEMDELEDIALALCDGTVLDVGAGAGTHSLLLQEKGVTVTALEISSLACDVMKRRGVKDVNQADIFSYSGSRYDTLLFLMNGIGLAGSINGFVQLLRHCQILLKPNGQILFDSSDISYLYADGLPKPSGYFGEITYQYEYKGHKGAPFQWLYLDQETLISVAQTEGWVIQVVFEDENDQYLTRLSRPQTTDLDTVSAVK